MKNLLIFIFSFLSLNALSAEVDVISAELGVQDHLERKTLCLTVVRVPQNGALLGVVESIEDCFYARKARQSPNHKIHIDLPSLRPLEVVELKAHLQTLDTQLKFLFSPGE